MKRDFIATLEKLSKSNTFRSGELLAATEEIIRESAHTLGCERVNTWVLNAEKNKMSSYRAYDSRTDAFTAEGVLTEGNLPHYFHDLLKEEIIISNVAREAPINQELIDIYIDPLGITAMIDVPVRSEGSMVGLVCFEHVKKKHKWTDEERKFTLSIANLLSLAYETYRRKRYQVKLERIIHEKVVLIAEVNHRVKNNMSVILSLINLQRHKCEDKFHESLFTDLSHRIYSMSEIQQQLHISQNYSEINLQQYLINLVANLNESYGADKSIKIDLNVKPIIIDITKAIPCGLIVNEVLSNSYKYAFGTGNKEPHLALTGEKKGNEIIITLSDNGPGLPPKNRATDGMGRELIEELTEQLSGEIEIASSPEGTRYTLRFWI